MILPSLLGPFQGMMADSSPTARFDEHRHPKNTIGLVCALGEQGRRTATIPTLCGRWASTRDQRAALSLLCALREHGRSTALVAIITPGAQERYGCHPAFPFKAQSCHGLSERRLHILQRWNLRFSLPFPLFSPLDRSREWQSASAWVHP